jgi:DNA excision repair protein ERCC-4
MNQHESGVGRRSDSPKQQPLIQDGMLPSYLSDAFGELYGEDGLVCLGKGLQWLALLSAFVRFYADDTDEGGGHASLMVDNEVERYRNEHRVPPPRPILLQKYHPQIFIIGLQNDAERATMVDMLRRWGTPDKMMPFMITNESGDSNDRKLIYQRHKIICITSRILIVDLLSSVITANDIDGILVGHGETVTEQSTEAFIIRIYQSQRVESRYDTGFIKAFSDAPDQLVSGFAQVDKVLKSLQVRKLYLYPRFHDCIRTELESNQGAPIVTELLQPLSLLQKDIQNSIAAAVVKCLRQLKSSTEHLMAESSSLNWDSASKNDLSIENCVTSYFDRAIARQLEPYWYRLKPQTKQLVTDLKTLRTLFHALLTYDCVSFWNLLCSIQSVSAASRHPALWLLDPAADVIYKKAKQRVYTIKLAEEPNQQLQQDGAIKTPTTNIATFQAVLEENPKWKLLKQVLLEIKERYQQDSATKEEDDYTYQNIGPTNILVMVKDDKALESIKSYLSSDGRSSSDSVMLKRWLRFLELCNNRSRTVTGVMGSTDMLSDENRLLLEEEGRVRRILFGGKSRRKERQDENSQRSGSAACNADIRHKTSQHHSDKNQLTSPLIGLNGMSNNVRKRRRVASEKGRGGRGQSGKDDLERLAVLEEAIEKSEADLMNSAKCAPTKRIRQTAKQRKVEQDEHVDNFENNDDNNLQTPEANKNENRYAILGKDIDRYGNTDENIDDDNDALFETYYPDDEIRIVVRSYTSLEGEQELLFLQDIRPRYIVFYDSDVAFVRAVEIYSSLLTSSGSKVGDTNVEEGHYKRRVHVYFLMFEASAEEKNFKKMLEREQGAFEKLIHHKQTMAPPVLYSTGMTQEMTCAMEQGSAAGSYMGGTLPLAFDTTTTRQGRGKFNLTKVRRDIVVDVREFRSALPSILHLNGMRLAPVTLTVGDFVLTNVHCIERKSISDLFGSFGSGRLYTQAQTMSKYYKCPCLLIEFDPNKSFCLQNQRELGIEIRTDSVCSKMALLTMHFPKLRLLWSRGPHETFKIFRELKTNHDEPDVDKAIEAGRNETDDDYLSIVTNEKKEVVDAIDDSEEDEINEVARDMLLRLPGVNTQSARKILSGVDNLTELCCMSRDDLRKIAGPSTGQKLFTFFRQTISNASIPPVAKF